MTPELHDNDNCDCNRDPRWPMLVVREGDPTPEEPCTVCGAMVRWRELAIVAQQGLLCDVCSRALIPEVFVLTRHVIGMADWDDAVTWLTLRKLLEWLDLRGDR